MPETYNEIGREQVVLGVINEADLATFLETLKEQVTLAVIELIGKSTTAAGQVNTDDDDCGKQTNPDSFRLGTVSLYAGAYSNETIEMGSGMRFTNITIPQGAVVDEAHLILRCRVSRDAETVNTRISAEDIDNPGTFINDVDVFIARWNARTAARVDWDAIPGWTAEEDYESPDIKTVIQEIVRRAGWVSGNSIVLFWEDFEDRSTHMFQRYRDAYSYDGSAEHAPKLVVAYTYAGEQYTIVESLEQTVLAVANETDLATFLETLKPQTVLAVIEKLEQLVIGERGREQTVLGVVEESDLMTFLETLKEQVILGVASETDLATFLETLKSQTILAVIEKLEQLIIVEIREQVALAIASETDLATFTEKLREHIILAVQFVILIKLVQRIHIPSRAYDLGAAPTKHDLGKMQDKYNLGKVK